jgi:hypothetical protein
MLVAFAEGQVEEFDRFSTVLGGLGGFITVEGDRVCLRDEGCDIGPEGPEERVEVLQERTVTAAVVEVCDPDLLDDGGRPLFCTKNESFRVNFFFYKSIGSETRITRGGIEFESCTTILEGIFTVCLVKAGSHTALALSQAYFGTFPPTFDDPIVVDTSFKSAINTNFIKSKHWNLFANITTECPFANRCAIRGVCALHRSSTEQDFGNGDTQVNTSKGDVGEGAPECPAPPPPIP